jgi:hypothetical protein
MKNAHSFFKLALCNLILFGWVSCSPAADQTSYSATPTNTPTPTIIFDTPKPVKVQGIRGQVMVASGPAPEPGAPSFWPGGNLEVVVLEAGTTRIVATTVTDSEGYYSLELMPGDYDICVNSRGLGVDRPCDERVIVTVGNFVRHDMSVAMQ